MKTLFYLALVLLSAGCFTTHQSFQTQGTPKNVFLDKYRSRIEPGSLLLNAGYHYSLEQTANGAYVRKTYFPETGQMTHFITYTDKTLRTRSGKATEWFDNGHKYKEGSYKNDKPEGFWQYYNHRNGKLTQSGNYVNGAQEGVWKQVDSTGMLQSEYTYKNDKKHGIYKKYNKAGELIETGEYSEDELIRQEKLKSDEVANESGIMRQVEEMPIMKTCATLQDSAVRKQCSDRTMLEYVYRNIRYPAIAREHGIEGMVIASFVIERDGSIAEVEIPRGLCQSIKNECERIVKNMPAWHPGMHDGKPVRVFFNLPIRFKLE